jgi:polyisoprenoid-binding protein YceI
MKQLSACAGLALAVPLAAHAELQSYTLDQYHTIPHFYIEYHGFGTIPGRFDKASGKFTIDRAARKASLDFVIETASITTGDGERGGRPRARDEHLRSADFFNVAEYPRMTFKSTQVKFNGEQPSEVEGTITLLGVTRPMTLKIDRWVCKDHPVYKKPSCGGNATGVLKRSEFGMKYAIPSLSDEVRLSTMFLAHRD